MGKLDGRVAIVTGAGQGIGRGLAIAYAKEGAKVVIAEINPKTGAAVAEEIVALGLSAIAVTCDVSDKEHIAATVQRTIDEYGQIDILVNNARANFTEYAAIEDLTEERFDRTYETNIRATWLFSRAVFRHMKDRGGRIINFGSAWGVVGAPGWSDYAGAKEAIRAFSRSAAREWGKYGITVNVICPGLASEGASLFAGEQEDDPTVSPTGVTEDAVASVTEGANSLGYFGDPERDGGPVAVFLASDESHYMTGQTFNVDGGGLITA